MIESKSVCLTKIALVIGVIHKGCPHKFGNFWDTPSLCPGLSTFGRPPPPPLLPLSPCPCGHKAGIIWNIAACEQFTLKGKKLIILFENNVKNIQMKTIFKMMSLHCVPCILYWIQAEWKFYIQTYCQIIWVNFTNMVATFFFPSGRPHLANHLLPLSAFVHFCLTPSPLMCGHPLWMAPYSISQYFKNSYWFENIILQIFFFFSKFSF